MAFSDPFQQISADFIHLGAMSDQALGPRQIMLVPGGDVAALSLDLPTGLRGQNREHVARRQLRDQIGLEADVAEMRPLQNRAGGYNWSRVLVVDHVLVDAWRKRAGAACSAVLPDYLALPTAPDLWSIAPTPSGVAVRLGPEDGFGAPNDTALALLRRALQDADPAPKALLRLGPATPELEAMFDVRGIPVIHNKAQAQALGVTVPQALAHGEMLMDLRRDPQMARSVLARRVLPWRWPVLLALLASGLSAASQYIVIERVKTQTTDIAANTTALVQEHFVTSGPVLDARIQVSQALAQLQAAAAGPMVGVDPMDLFNRAARVIAQQGATPKSVVMADEDTLAMILQVADFAAAEQVTAALSEARLEVVALDTRVSEGSDTVRIELRVTSVQEPKP